jgi:hypothetical protein
VAWVPPPVEPPAAGWWHSDPQPETSPVLDRPEWRVPALAARVRRTIRDIDAVLAAPACDCGYPNGCTYCRPDRRHTRPDYGIEGRSPVERRPCGPILSVR